MYSGVKSITRALCLCYGNSIVKIVSKIKNCWQPQSIYFWETFLRLETEHADVHVYVHHHVKTVIWGVCQSGTCNLYIMCIFIAFNVSGLSSSKCYTKEIPLANFHSARKTGVRPSTFLQPMATYRILTARLDSGKIKAIFKRQRYGKINIHNVRIYCKICIEI